MEPHTILYLLLALWCVVVLGYAIWRAPTRRTRLQQISDDLTATTRGFNALAIATNQAAAAFVAWGIAWMESFRRMYREEGAIYGDTDAGFERWCDDRRARYGGYLLPS